MEIESTKIQSMVDHLELVSRGGRQQLISLGNFDGHIREISAAIEASSAETKEGAAARGFLLRSVGSENTFLSNIADKIVHELTEGKTLGQGVHAVLSDARKILRTKTSEIDIRRKELLQKIEIINVLTGTSEEEAK
jgi:hypothetical protein